MAIYGTAILSACLLAGLVIGKGLGMLIGVEANVGGVGLAMLLLVFVCHQLQRTGFMAAPSQQGILFWSAIYIPVIVAMAASQNVLAAVRGSPAAIAAGVLTVGFCFILVPAFNSVAQRSRKSPDHDHHD
ncbi:MAG: malonate transporter subunit MadL [Endozoicomonas sp.]